jgi:hypothetical protein
VENNVAQVLDVAYFSAMDEVLILALEFLEDALHTQDNARRGAYLWMAGRSLQTAVELYEDRRKSASVKQGE